ncbi:MAG TPA: hypothetical protein VFC78_18950, partial [Tepidisphaeraceae bacterium]|nr:hypothetical protein [Tepidisphaeraceae bacterium]
GPRRDRSWADCRVRMTLSEARRHAGTTTSSRTVFWFFEHTRRRDAEKIKNILDWFNRAEFVLNANRGCFLLGVLKASASLAL